MTSLQVQRATNCLGREGHPLQRPGREARVQLPGCHSLPVTNVFSEQPGLRERTSYGKEEWPRWSLLVHETHKTWVFLGGKGDLSGVG